MHFSNIKYIIKLLSIKFIILFSIFSCSPKRIKKTPTKIYDKTSRMILFGDSARMEIEEYGELTINRYIKFDNLERTTFRNYTVSSFHKLEQKNEKPIRNFVTLELGKYLLKLSINKDSKDTNAMIRQSLFNGKFKCFKDSNQAINTFILEERTQGNGTYGNELFLINPDLNDTIQFLDFGDQWLVKSYIWDEYKCIPMSWDEYKKEKKRLSNFNKDLIKSN